jgi:hypothetical protein
MSDNFLSSVAAVTEQLNSKKRDQEKLALLARALRWHRSFDADDMAALETLIEIVPYKRGAGCWDVEQAVLEILCERAEVEHVPFLIETFRRKTPGKHSNNRRRLALQALSSVAARTGHQGALLVLEEGLAHHKKDTRGWTIGFLLDTYTYLGRPLPQSVVDQLRFLVENDVSSDVRVEAVTALASVGLTDQATVETTIAVAQRGLNGAAKAVAEA